MGVQNFIYHRKKTGINIFTETNPKYINGGFNWLANLLNYVFTVKWYNLTNLTSPSPITKEGLKNLSWGGSEPLCLRHLKTASGINRNSA